MWARVGIIGNPPRLALSRDIFNLMIYAARNEELSIGCAQEELPDAKEDKSLWGRDNKFAKNAAAAFTDTPPHVKTAD